MGSLSCKGGGTAWEPRIQLTAFPQQRDAHRRADGGEDSRCTHLLRDGDAIPLISGALASCYARPLLDIGTGIFSENSYQPSAVSLRPSAVERTGADVQFILPGNGWLLCWGGVANPHDTLPRRQTALSLRGVREQSHCLNAVTAHCSIRLLEDLVAGRLTQLV
jgi:hypothetical protein